MSEPWPTRHCDGLPVVRTMTTSFVRGIGFPPVGIDPAGTELLSKLRERVLKLRERVLPTRRLARW